MTASDLPRISVITPSFNQGHFLRETIESVLDQKYSNLDYIIMDGGSTDNSVQIIKHFEKYLSHWVSEPDRGQTDAINKGFRLASGDVLTWLNADDLYFEDTLATVGAAFQKYREDVIYGDYVLITQNGKTFLKRYEIPFDFNIMLYGVNFIGQPSAFFKRSLLDRFGFLNESYQYAMDHEFWLRIASGGGTFRHIKHLLGKYRYHSDSKTVAAKKKFVAEMELNRRTYGNVNSILLRTILGYWTRFKRQMIKLIYRGRIDFLGGPLNRIWYRCIQAYENRVNNGE
jgi:glycosyltransferase involved in cell wall biosynthesis